MHPRNWWRRPASNRRPPACKAGALPTELHPQSSGHRDALRTGAGRGNRTLPARRGRPLPNRSARPACAWCPAFAGPHRLWGSGLRPAGAQHFSCAPSREQWLVPVGAAYRDDCAGGASALPCFSGQHRRVGCRRAVARASLVCIEGFEPPSPLREADLQSAALSRSAKCTVSLPPRPMPAG